MQGRGTSRLKNGGLFFPAGVLVLLLLLLLLVLPLFPLQHLLVGLPPLLPVQHQLPILRHRVRDF